MRTHSIAFCGFVATIVATCSAGCNAVDLIQSAKATRTETFDVPVPEAKQCRIQTFNGSVECIAGSVGEIQVEAQVTAKASTIERAEEYLDLISVDHDEIDGVAEITANIPRGISGSVSLIVTLPADIELSIKTSNGQVNVVGNTEGTTARTSNGAIKLEECLGGIEARSSNGSIKIHGDRLDEVNAVTSNGRIEVEGEFSEGNHRIRTSNGKIEIEAHGRPIRFMADTSNGRIRANGRKVKKRKTVTLGVASSQADRSDDSIARLALETSNGSIDVEHESDEGRGRDRSDDDGDSEDQAEDDDAEDPADEEDFDEDDQQEEDDEDEEDDKDKKGTPIGAAILKSLGL